MRGRVVLEKHKRVTALVIWITLANILLTVLQPTKYLSHGNETLSTVYTLSATCS